MDQKIKQQWVEALRSGKYIQGTGALRRPTNEYITEESFCCLGVLCDIVDPDGWEESTMWSYNHRENKGYPGPLVMQKTGLGHLFIESLASLNDTGATFEEIAQKILEDA